MALETLSFKKRDSGPDRGWSWVVALAACFCSLVLAGIFRTGGVLFVAFLDAFGVTREEASWPMVICISVLNLTGPFSGILSKKYGIRPIVMLGAVVGAIGVSACFFTTSLNVITILFGGVFGVGYGLVNTLTPVIVNAYFLNLRGLANGIANSGSCFGSVILPVLFEYLIAHFGLSGCFLLTGGIVLNVAVAGALLRPPPWLIKTDHKYSRNENSSQEPLKNVASDSECRIQVIECPNSSEQLFHKSGKSEKIPSDLQYEHHNDLHAELVETLKHRSRVQDTKLDNFIQYKDPSFDSIFHTTSSLILNNRNEQNEHETELFRVQKEFQESLNDFQSVVVSILETSQSEEILNKLDSSDDVKTSALTDSCPARHSFSISSGQRPRTKFSKSSVLSTRPLKKSNLKFESSSGDLFPVPETSEKFEMQVKSGNNRTPLAAMEEIEEDKQIETDNRDSFVTKKESVGVTDSFKTVLTCPMFYVTALTNVSFYFLFHMYVVIIVDYSLDCGVPQDDTKYIIFAFSAADLFGRLCLGWITDRRYVTRSHFAMICMAAIGVVFFTFPFATQYWSLILASCAYGVLLGCTMIVFPILLVDYLGTEMHAVAYGCMCFLNGFASLLRPITIGYFRDNIGSYAYMFYILGIVSVISAAAWLLEKCFLNEKRDKSSVLEKVISSNNQTKTLK